MSVKKLTVGEKRFFFLLIPIAILITLFAGVFLFQNPDSAGSSTTSGHAAVGAPAKQDLTGDWTADNGNNTKIVATVKDNTIKILLKSTDVEMTYWSGTFVNSAIAGDQIASIKSQALEMIMSQAESKTFAIGDKSLSFDMSAFGVTKHVTMTHI
jgi:hypothetical protein